MNPNRHSPSSSQPSPPSAVSPLSSRNHSPSDPLRRTSSSTTTSISLTARSPSPSSSTTPAPLVTGNTTTSTTTTTSQQQQQEQQPPLTTSYSSSSIQSQSQILQRHRSLSESQQSTSDMTVVSERERPRERREKSSKSSRSSQQHTKEGSTPKGTAPLLSSASYVVPPPPSIAFVNNTTSLAELAHLVRLQSYQSLKHTQCRVKLHRQLINSAISARLNRSGELARQHMVEFFKSDQKRDFAVLYNAVHELRDSCERLAMLQPELDITKTVTGDPDSERPKMLVTFLHEVPAQARDTLLRFVAMIRSNPKFLADRLAKLTPAELDQLAKHHLPSPPPDSTTSTSVLPAGRKGATTAAPAMPTPSAVEKLLSFQRHDPIYTLIHTAFANSSGPDSAEDRRRTDVWATACARLLNQKKGEKFLLAVMDAWAATRGWPAKGNLEVCLMSFLQQGAFLLDRNEEQQQQQQAPVKGQPDLGKKYDHMSEEFYTKAVRKLFEVLDDEPSAGGIPEGILELGNAILEKIDDPSKKKYACGFIVANWFFGKFLNSAIQYPEFHGMMVGHHINEYARQRILRTIFQRMYTAVFNISYAEWKRSGPMDPVVRTHIENIMGRFRCSRPKDSNPVLIPAKSMTSPRETEEVQPYIVVCAADIITMYNSLFPATQTRSAAVNRDIMDKRYPRSVSSRPLASRPPSIFETSAASVISHGSSSVFSESAMSGPSAPLLVNTASSRADESSLFGSPTIASPTNSFNMQIPSLQPSGASIHSFQSITSEHDLQMESFAYEVKAAVSDMVRCVGVEATSARVHPCAEKWAVLFVSPDGSELSMRMRTDWDDDDDDDDEMGHDSDSEDEAVGEVSGLDRDYNQLKEAVMKLVEEYEVPEELIENEHHSKKFSNRTSTAVRKPSSPIASLLPAILPDQAPSGLSALFDRYPTHERQRLDIGRDSTQSKRGDSEQTPVLLTMLSAASNQCTLRGDFIDGERFHRAIVQLQKLSPSLVKNGYSALLHIFSRGFRDYIEKSAGAMEHLDAWFAWLTLAQERHDSANEGMLMEIKNLRVKMWYVTDVRNSAAYDDARNVAMALKKMGIPVKPTAGKGGSSTKSRSGLTHRMSTSSFSLLKSDSIIDTLSAPLEHGGPNKLVDDQAEVTTTWMKKYDIQNLCQSEERIHRFCCEVDKCVNKLVGDKILTGPVLWSSELFARDERELASVRRKGDFHLAGVGALSMTLDDGHDTDTRKHDAGLKNKASAGDLFSLGRNRSQSIVSAMSDAPSNRTRGGRGSSGESMMDRQDFLSGQSPSMSVDSPPSSAFWSPFAASPSNSSTATSRPKLQHSSTSLSSLKPPGEESAEKKNFLTQLKQTLTGLLLSDVGMDVWSQGSETDSWFSGGLADECLQRKEDQENAKQKSINESKALVKNHTGGSVKKMSRKKSIKNLKKQLTGNGIFEALGKGEKGELAAPVATFENASHEPHSGEENSSSSDATSRASTTTAAAAAAAAAIRKGGVLPFPYGVAFRRLLLKFSTHPNPFAKLRAIHDLEVLIVASLTSTTGKTVFRRGGGNLPTVPTDAFGELTSRMNELMNQPPNMEDAIANIDDRRHGGAPASPFLTPTGARSPAPMNAPNADMIVEVWLQLLRQADVRPRTLFRDLQFIASFVDNNTLDKTPMGKAFWDMALAALALKMDVCKTMVEVADEIVGYHTKKRGAESAAAAAAAAAGSQNPDKLKAQHSGTATPPQEWIARYTMRDAAKMWLITAKEGDPTAQRELAIFYLTNPSLLPLATAPLSKTKNIFRSDMMAAKGVDPEKCDPARLCVSHHWMELSAREDELAKKYLRQREDQW